MLPGSFLPLVYIMGCPDKFACASAARMTFCRLSHIIEVISVKKIVIFYDDTKTTCREYARMLEKHGQVECRKASEELNHTLIFAGEGKFGLMFESNYGEVPYEILHVIWRITADKKEHPVLLITGGSREFKALRTAAHELGQRGYIVKNIYSRYLIQKQKMKTEDAVEWIIHDLEENRENIPEKEQLKAMNKRELRRRLREELKSYKKYAKKREDERWRISLGEKG